MASGSHGPTTPGVNFLRQEIRGVMVLEPTSNSSPGGTAHSTGSGTPKESQQHTPELTTTTPNSANISNRLSKLPSQLQQQHFKNLWKHYRMIILKIIDKN